MYVNIYVLNIYMCVRKYLRIIYIHIYVCVYACKYVYIRYMYINMYYICVYANM